MEEAWAKGVGQGRGPRAWAKGVGQGRGPRAWAKGVGQARGCGRGTAEARPRHNCQYRCGNMYTVTMSTGFLSARWRESIFNQVHVIAIQCYSTKFCRHWVRI